MEWVNAIIQGLLTGGLYALDGLGKAGIEIDRKMLADLAVHDADAFGAIAQQAKTALESAIAA